MMKRSQLNVLQIILVKKELEKMCKNNVFIFEIIINEEYD